MPGIKAIARRLRMLTSLGWRIGSWPLRHRRLPGRSDLAALLRHARSFLRARRQEPTLPPINPRDFLPSAADPYDVWVANNRMNERSIQEAQDAINSLVHRPLVSVIMPVYNIEACWLEKAVASVYNQIYPHWELCIADDASTEPEVRPLLRQLASSDNRIRVRFIPGNVNISLATNAAAEMARGEYLVFLDQDDELTPDCLLELVRATGANSDADLLYSDDDKIDVNGHRFAPQFKPDWSPELLLSYMYCSHVFCVRRSLFEKLGGFRAGFEGCQDYDFALRASEYARKVVHIPRVLYHWRCLPSSTATSGGAKPEAFKRGIEAVQQALDRRGVKGVVSRPDFAIREQLGIFQIDFPDSGPKVSILIPTRDKVELLRKCIDSILQRTTYHDYEIVILDNGSTDPSTLSYFKELPDRCRLLRLECPGGLFNYAWLHNEAVKSVNGELIVLLNNDTEVRRGEWLSQMVGYAQMDDVGAVGARLLYDDNRVQHAGVILGLHRGMAGHAFKLLAGQDGGYLSYVRVTRNYSAVTAACLLVHRQLYLEVGGLDATRFAVAYNDVDFCLRLRERGLRMVYAPRAELTHYESASRGFVDNPQEIYSFHQLWGNRLDPYYNPNLSLDDELFRICTRRQSVSLPQQKAVRALLCSHNLNLEGAPNSLYELALGLKQRGLIAPEIYSPVDGPLAQRYRQAGIPIHIMPHPLGLRSEHSPSLEEQISGFARWAEGKKFDVLHANTLLSFWVAHAARKMAVPCLWNVRETENWTDYFLTFDRSYVRPVVESFALAYRVIFVAEATRNHYTALNTHHNFDVIHNGLRRESIDQFKEQESRESCRRRIGCPPGRTVISIVGTVCERKGQLDFTRAALELLRRGRRDVFFYIVGCRPGPYMQAIEQLTSQFPDFFGLVPEADHVYDYYRSSDVFVCCSNNESFPRVILEAMAFELPIVTTWVHGIQEQVIPNVSALTFLPADVDGLTDHLSHLLRNPEERARLASAAVTALNHLPSYQDMIQQYEWRFLEAYSIGSGSPQGVILQSKGARTEHSDGRAHPSCTARAA